MIGSPGRAMRRFVVRGGALTGAAGVMAGKLKLKAPGDVGPQEIQQAAVPPALPAAINMNAMVQSFEAVHNASMARQQRKIETSSAAQRCLHSCFPCCCPESNSNSIQREVSESDIDDVWSSSASKFDFEA